jgi:hypothetical protein
MTMTLTNNKTGESIASYDPDKPQWWITSFNPAFQDQKSSDLTAEYVVDFSGDTGMYGKFSEQWSNDKRWTFDPVNHTAKLEF